MTSTAGEEPCTAGALLRKIKSLGRLERIELLRALVEMCGYSGTAVVPLRRKVIPPDEASVAHEPAVYRVLVEYLQSKGQDVYVSQEALMELLRSSKRDAWTAELRRVAAIYLRGIGLTTEAVGRVLGRDASTILYLTADSIARKNKWEVRKMRLR